MQAAFFFSTILHGSDQYEQMLRLRLDVLLQPIGIGISFINVPNEKNDLLLGAFREQELMACCVLTRLNNDLVQLRQMAVSREMQGQGLGAALVQFAEQKARENRYLAICLHARSTVVSFYEKSGYVIVGVPFEEVGIEHYRMEKRLQ